MVQLKAPWNERNGRFSPLKAVVFAGLFVPAAWIAWLAATGALEPKVVTEMIHRTGLWAIRFLTLSLLITPLMRGARYPKFVAVRRMIGVAAFAYACAHLSLYVVDQHFDLAHVASEIALRFYLTIGFVAFLGLAALAATSTDAMIRRLGRNWRRLHSIVYALALIALLHFMIQAKADVSEPVMMTGFFAVLMLFRVFVKRGAEPWVAALAAAVISPPLTALSRQAGTRSSATFPSGRCWARTSIRTWRSGRRPMSRRPAQPSSSSRSFAARPPRAAPRLFPRAPPRRRPAERLSRPCRSV